MATPENPEWKGMPRQRQRPKVDTKSPFFGLISKTLTSNRKKNENSLFEALQEISSKENIGECCEVKDLVKRKDEEKIKTDSKFEYKNVDLEDNGRHTMKESNEERKPDPNAKFKHTCLDIQSSQRNITKNKHEEVRTKLNFKFEYKILDYHNDMQHQTKTGYGTNLRTESDSKINRYNTNFQDQRKMQEKQYENQVKSRSKLNYNNSSSLDHERDVLENKCEKGLRRERDHLDFLDNKRYSINREHKKDSILDCGDNPRILTKRRNEVVDRANRANSKSATCHSVESYGKHSYSSKPSDNEVKKSNFRLENQNYRAKNDKEMKVTSVHPNLTSSSFEHQEYEEIMESKQIHDMENFKVTIKNDETRLVHLTSFSKEITSSNNVSESQGSINKGTESAFLVDSSTEPVSSNIFSESLTSINEAVPIFSTNPLTEITSFNDILESPTNSHSSALMYVAPLEENYIPPPVECKAIREDSGFHEDSSNSAFQNGNSEALPEFNNLEDESYYSLPDTEQIEAISDFILKKVKEKSVHSAAADKIVRDLNAVFKDQLDGHIVHLYGSYSSNLAISTSDINIAMVSDCPRSVKKSFMFEVYKVILEEFKNSHVYPYEEGTTIFDTKINFSHPKSGVKCQLAYLGKLRDNICKMGQFLREISSSDERVKTLILAVKIWAESLSINEVEDGKLHSLGFALMVVHFLQHCDNPILPAFPCEKDEKEILNSTSPNNLSIGELWLAFLKYYASTFDWKQNVVSVKSNTNVSKQSKSWESYWLAVEDPFTENNVARSVKSSDIADYIKALFKSSYDYFCNPPEYATNDSLNENDSNGSHSDTKWEFSFDHCNYDQDDMLCEDCDELMDTCDNCQKKMYVEPIFTAPKMTDDFLEIVKDSLMTVYRNYMLTDEEVNERKDFVTKLKTKISRFYKSDVFSDAEFSIFGSSANGFGFKKSDLDICLTFKSNKDVDRDSVLKGLRSVLRRDRDFEQVIVIFRATIPIVKFYYKPKGWRGDISLHNSLAIHNSNLLYTYSLLDERCKILGCALKLLAKKALISEVSDKALSSYSYLIMVIYFLQQTDPPVLPVLQDNKFRNNNYEINHIVDSCNVWFCKDLDYIKTVFQSENKTPVEQLWLDLLDFYSVFDTERFISIRQKEPVIADGNKSRARLFNIQDPFIETKNLGRVVSSKKAQEMINVLRRARKMFRTPLKELPSCVKDSEDYFFSTQSLTGRIHKEVLCEICGKYGHGKEECPHFSFFSRFPFKHNPNNRFSFRKDHPTKGSPYKNYASRPKSLHSGTFNKRA